MDGQQPLDLGGEAVMLAGETDFAGWRLAARRLILAEVSPQDVRWVVASQREAPPPLTPPHNGEGNAADGISLSGSRGTTASATPRPCGEGMGVGVSSQDSLSVFTVPRAYVEIAEAVICHCDPERFALLYRVLYRLRREPGLMHIASDPEILRLRQLEKAVGRDIHKMRAFVRFRQIEDETGERHIAWFEPSHHIVERNAPFFVRRFTGMRWTIMTPLKTADWDGEHLVFGPGADRRDAPTDDEMEELWSTYYANIFNPARLKVRAMQAEMPKKYWRNLPEASLIPDLIAGADKAASEMIARMPTMPAPHHAKVQEKHWPRGRDSQPSNGDAAADTLDGLAAQAKGCRRCPLWRDATQTVFGEGPENARVVFVGEQPGDQEDLAGKPFVGPAGRVFDNILDEAGVDRTITYVTNAVKHFKFEPRGKRRIHSKPNAGEVKACRWWLSHELDLIKPDLVVALGATAAQSLLERPVPVTRERGQVLTRDDGLRVFVTIHPSYLLRIRDEADKQAERARFLEDMRKVKMLMAA